MCVCVYVCVVRSKKDPEVGMVYNNLLFNIHGMNMKETVRN